jgi:hypothetical protein
LHTIARHNQHVPKLGHIGFVAQRAMPRNDLVVVGQGQNFVGGDNHPVDFSAGAGVDDGAKAVKKISPMRITCGISQHFAPFALPFQNFGLIFVRLSNVLRTA